MSRNSVGYTFMVAGLLCVVCSIMVSAAAVGLKSFQEANRKNFKDENILIAAGVPEDQRKEARDRIVSVLVDLETGKELKPEEYPEGIDKDLAKFDAEKVAADDKNLGIGTDLAEADIKDPAGIKHRENFAVVYKLMKSKGSDEVEQYVLPVRGKGLWSTLYGFMAVKPDLKTVAGLTFYKHGETPGLGGEVDNKDWKAQWPNLQIYNESGDVQLEVVKGKVDRNSPLGTHAVDGLSGATLTSNGVEYLVNFWLGPNGYKPYLENLRKN